MKSNSINGSNMKKILLYFSSILCLILIPILILTGGTVNPKEKPNSDVEDSSKNSNNKDFSYINVHNVEGNKNSKIELEQYVLGVLAAEMPAEFDLEALKAQAVAARTYALKRIIYPCEEANGADICDTVHCQVYMDKEKRMLGWDKAKGEEYWKKLEQAVKETKGKVLSYEGSLVLYPQFFATSWGKTEDSAAVFSSDVPYLKSVDSPGEEEISKSYKSSKEVSVNEFISKVNGKYKDAKLNASNLKSSIKVLSKNPGGSVAQIQLGAVTIKGTEFRTLLDLKSANFNVTINGSKVLIDCTGYGHGVGMSQWGANAMGKKGSKYDEILKHYYQGVEIEDIKEIKVSS